MLKTNNREDVYQLVEIKLPEWSIASPQTHNLLQGFSFENDSLARKLAKKLTASGQVEFYELKDGLEIHTTSVVGSFQIGNLSLTIVPKINGLPLFRLVRFAYGLRDLELFNTQNFNNQYLAFQDLLILQFVVEVQELFSRGLLRNYQRKDEPVTSPVGKINFQRFASQGGLIKASLPCTYYNRLENCLHNQAILSGLILASQITRDLSLKISARRLANRFSQSVEKIHLQVDVLEQVDRASNRLTEAYSPALKLIALLLGNIGISNDENLDQVQVNGFLFDMGHFFQALLSRLLKDYLEGYKVEDEHKLKGLLAYVPGYQLPHRLDPMPRPDFAIFEKEILISLLDAKYRDIWKFGLPRDMLYQLIVYALSQKTERKAAILYPSLDEVAKDAIIQINEPTQGSKFGSIILRPVNLYKLENLIVGKRTDKLNTFAHRLID
jgi:5-methylcytosine-specific restriction enzyme subunit McrC